MRSDVHNLSLDWIAAELWSTLDDGTYVVFGVTKRCMSFWKSLKGR